jgi:hypothetical protein
MTTLRRVERPASVWFWWSWIQGPESSGARRPVREAPTWAPRRHSTATPAGPLVEGAMQSSDLRARTPTHRRQCAGPNPVGNLLVSAAFSRARAKARRRTRGSSDSADRIEQSNSSRPSLAVAFTLNRNSWRKSGCCKRWAESGSGTLHQDTTWLRPVQSAETREARPAALSPAPARSRRL